MMKATMEEFERVILYEELKFVGTLEKEDLDQISSVLFIKACQSYDESRGVKFVTYLINVLYHGYVNEYNRHKEINHEVPSSNNPNLFLYEGSNISLNSIEDYEFISCLKMCLGKLKAKEKEAVMVYLREENLKSYAEKHGINYITFIRRKNRGLKDLRKILKDENIVE